MNCEYVSGLISEYVDGNLDEATKAELDSHFDGCEACSAELDSTKRLIASLSGLGGLRSPVDCWAGVQTRIGVIEAAKRAWWRWVLRPVIAAPAAAVMALLALFLLWPLTEQAPMASDKTFAPEYSYYIGAHSHLQGRQALVDRDAVFIKGEMQKASLVSEAGEE